MLESRVANGSSRLKELHVSFQAKQAKASPIYRENILRSLQPLVDKVTIV
jgi:hypothetical protein